MRGRDQRPPPRASPSTATQDLPHIPPKSADGTRYMLVCLIRVIDSPTCDFMLGDAFETRGGALASPSSDIEAAVSETLRRSHIKILVSSCSTERREGVVLGEFSEGWGMRSHTIA